MTVAEMRQNLTVALAEVEAGEIYVVTRHRRPIARIVPVEVEPVVVIPARDPGPSSLSSRPRSGMAPYEATEAAWAEMGTE